jgi:alanine dehydrogenase
LGTQDVKNLIKGMMRMALFLHNDDVKELLTMDMTIDALEDAYTLMSTGQAVCRPRIDLQIPTGDPDKTYRFGTMEGGAANGYYAIRMKSDVLYESEYSGTKTLEKYCVTPGTFCGLIFLLRVDNGEPLAIINDGHLQHMRVGADSAIGAKYMAKEGEVTIGMIGSGGMARSHIDSIRVVRTIKGIKVFSPTKANRELYAREIEEKYGIETIPFDNPEEVYKDVDILCSCTDASIPVIQGRLIEKGTHVTSVGGRPDSETYKRVDRYLRLGSATAPLGKSIAHDEFISYVTPSLVSKMIKREHVHASGVINAIDTSKMITYKDILSGVVGRTAADQITYSERGNLQGAQFHAVAGKVYEAAMKQGKGRVLPTEWFLQDIRD